MAKNKASPRLIVCGIRNKILDCKSKTKKISKFLLMQVFTRRAAFPSRGHALRDGLENEERGASPPYILRQNLAEH